MAEHPHKERNSVLDRLITMTTANILYRLHTLFLFTKADMKCAMLSIVRQLCFHFVVVSKDVLTKSLLGTRS